MGTKIKICGLTRPEEATYLNEIKADYAGFVFYEPSKRNLTVEKAREIFKELNSDIKKVAVMVSPDKDLITTLQKEDFDILQIHKKLTVEVLREADRPVWYAVNIEDMGELKKTTEYVRALPRDLSKKITGLVVDAKNFGSGVTFNWQKSKDLKESFKLLFEGREFILAGGLSKENVAEGITFFEPDTVDVSSKVEDENGKNKELIKEFASSVRSV